MIKTLKSKEKAYLPVHPFKIKVTKNNPNEGAAKVLATTNNYIELDNIPFNSDLINKDYRHKTILYNSSNEAIEYTIEKPDVSLSDFPVGKSINDLIGKGIANIEYLNWSYYENLSLDDPKLLTIESSFYVYQAPDSPFGKHNVIVRNLPAAIHSGHSAQHVHQLVFQENGTGIYVRSLNLNNPGTTKTNWKMISPSGANELALKHLTVPKADYDAKVQELEGRIAALEAASS